MIPTDYNKWCASAARDFVFNRDTKYVGNYMHDKIQKDIQDSIKILEAKYQCRIDYQYLMSEFPLTLLEQVGQFCLYNEHLGCPRLLLVSDVEKFLPLTDCEDDWVEKKKLEYQISKTKSTHWLSQTNSTHSKKKPTR